MRFTLSAVGDELSRSHEAAVIGGLADAIREAEAILEQDPACETVEIFGDGRFLREVPRRLH